jgi:hypothetical protein
MLGLSTAADQGSRVLLCAVAGVLATTGALWSLLLGYADLEFRRGSGPDIAMALRVAPRDAGYLAEWSLVTQNREEAISSLERAVIYNPWYSWAWIQLGLAAEGNDRNDIAERDLLRAASVDRGFAPRWALCNFFFRRKNTNAFWYWSKQALAVNEAESGPVFRLDWRMDPDARTILNRGVPADKTARREFLQFLIEEQPDDGIFAVVPALLPNAEQEDSPLLVSYASLLLNERHVKHALSLWNSLCERGFVPFRAISPDSANVLTNPDFSTFPSGNVFDWRFDAADGVTVEKEMSSHEFRVRLSGLEPENYRILSQQIAVGAGRRYEFHFHARVPGHAADSGLRWKVLGGAGANLTIAESADLARSESTDGTMTFVPDVAAADEQLVTLVLDYNRPRGATRLAAMVAISNVSLHPVTAPGKR